MFKWAFGIALTVSIVFCAVMEYRSQRTLTQYHSEIEAKRPQLQPLKPYVDEIVVYEKKKEALQKRIDMINQLKMQQRGPVPALEKLANVDPNGVESIAVVGKDLVVNRR